MRGETDYLVVGAGAAGSALGYLLRRAGASVLVVELLELARKDKLCGGMLGAGSGTLLKGIYGVDVPAELGAFRSRRLLSRCLGRQIATEVGFTTVARRRLDDWLLGRYLGAGGAVRDRTRIVAIDAAEHVATATDLRTHETRHISYGALVGADGAASATRRLLAGRRQRTIVSVEARVPYAGADVIFAYHPARMGYCWYIPTGKEANAGCCLYGAGARACRAWLAEFCRDAGLSPAGLRGAPIPTGDDVLLRPAEGAYLAGDAAGLITPSVSGGIHHALASALALSATLLGGTPYEQAMAHTVERIRDEAAKLAERYLLASLTIARKGEAYARRACRDA